MIDPNPYYNQKKYDTSLWIKQPQNIKIQKLSPISIFSVIMVVIFIAESIVMIVLSRIHISSTLIESFIDSLFLLILLFPVLYFFLFKPLTNNVAELIELNKISNSLAIFAQLNPAPAFRINPDGKILLSNQAANDLSKHEKVEGQNITNFLSLSKTGIKEFIYKGKSTVLEETINKKNFQFTIVGVPELEVVHIYGNEITSLKGSEKLQSSLYEISEAAQSSDNLEKLFKVIHSIIGDLMPTKNFYIALYDDKKELLSFPYFVDDYDERLPAPKKLGKGLTEYVIRTGEPLLATSEVIEELADKKEIKVIGTLPIVWLGVPLKTKDKTIGLVATQTYSKSAELTDEHKSILKFVSAQMAMAIQHKQAQEENRILAKFTADNPNPIMCIGRDTTILYANEPSIAILDNWHTKVGQLLPGNWRQTIQEVLDTCLSKNLEIEIENRIFSFVVTPMGDGDIAYLYALDITSRKRAEKKLRKTNQEVIRTNTVLEKTMRELEEARDELKSALEVAEESDKHKSEFLANTSHELRTPLNSIIGFLKLTLDGMCDSPEEEREFLTNALTSSNHLLKLINNILDIAKIEAGKLDVNLQSISLNNLFDEINLLTSVQTANKNIDLEFVFEENEEIFIYADIDKVKQILINLIGNSLKFTTKGNIFVSGKTISEESIAMIQIKDTGIGIPPDKQKGIFDKFNQVNGSGSKKFIGTGLGLSITKSLVNLMGGTIELSSPGLNMGTVVSFSLPLSKNANHIESDIQTTVGAFQN